ncbi:MAG: helix-turn-helix domain-containing protein [Clostridia bacterium]
MLLRKAYTCPLELTHDMIKGKWKTIILWRLRLGHTSLAKLEKDIEGITQKMLLEQLKELIAFGLVDKKTYEGFPLRVAYFLTEARGQKILKALEIMQAVGIDYMVENNMTDVLREKGVIP